MSTTPHTFPAGGGHVYAETEGSGPCLLIAGGGPGVGHTHYHPRFSTLADRFTVVYLDYPGTGRSDGVSDAGSYSIESYADALETVRAGLSADWIFLVGVSFGGRPAIEYTLRHPERVRGLVMSNAQLSAATWHEGNIDNVNAAMRQHFPERWEQILSMREQGTRSLDPEYQELYGELVGDLEWVDPYGHPRMQRDETDSFREEVYAAIVGDDPEWTISGTLAGYDPVPRMASLQVPTLVVSGRWDRLTTPALARLTCAALPNAETELLMMERSAHRPWVEEPDAYFEAVARFLVARASGVRP